MAPGPDGFRPLPGFLQQQLAQIPELQDASMPRIEVIEFNPVIDSSNMTPEHWMKLARMIHQNLDAFDGFVVLHGTDTLAYTASALPFMLEGLDRPVILTGSQLPLSEVRNDARENLKTSILLAADERISEVGIFFGDQLLRGCRSIKSSAVSFHAFDSPNYPPLAEAGTRIVVYPSRLRPAAQGSRRLHSIHPIEMATFRLFPGLSVPVLENVLQRPLKALILESYGDGNGPAQDASFLTAIRRAVDGGTVIVNCSQCRHGAVSQSNYETGTVLARAGVVSGYDLTIEAAVAKLMFLFSQHDSVDEVKRLMVTDLVGELTVPAEEKVSF